MIYEEKPYPIFVVSDATGETAEKVIKATLMQFQDVKVSFHRCPMVRNVEEVSKIVKKAKEVQGLIVFTLVSKEIRNAMLEESQRLNVVAVDIVGPLLRVMSGVFSKEPQSKPGLLHQINDEYFRRIEAVEFAVKHDDGLRSDELVEADIILIGVSRTSKTPLSFYLAHKGWKVANVPIIKDHNTPQALEKIDKRRIIGLTIISVKLLEIRKERAKNIGLSETDEYANLQKIKEELNYSKEVFKKLGISVIDVTEKSVEEMASEILKTISNNGIIGLLMIP